MTVGAGAISVTHMIGQLAVFGSKALPMVRIIAPFVPLPFFSAVVEGLTVAQPWIEKIALGAPLLEKTIADGEPVLAALRDKAPELLADFKALFAIAVNHDPARPESGMTADDVSDSDAAAFAEAVVFTPGWTNQETERWWKLAQGQA